MTKALLATAALVATIAIASPALARGGHGSFGGRASYGGYGSLGGSHRATTGEHWTNSYTTRSGSYVQGHYATNPNGTRNDNYSTVGNVNPHTGVAGTKPGDGY